MTMSKSAGTAGRNTEGTDRGNSGRGNSGRGNTRTGNADRRISDSENTRNLRTIGTLQERRAGDFLIHAGYHICMYNFRCRTGEIDIIATEGDTLVFVEVKYRSGNAAGSPFEAVTPRKQRTICRCADLYRIRYRIPPHRPCRFDVVGICGDDVRLIRKAFPYAAW